MNIHSIWSNILKHQNEIFKTKRGKSYTYVVVDNYVFVNNDEAKKYQNIVSKKQG